MLIITVHRNKQKIQMYQSLILEQSNNNRVVNKNLDISEIYHNSLLNIV